MISGVFPLFLETPIWSYPGVSSDSFSGWRDVKLCDPGATKANQLQGDDSRRSEGCRCRAEKQGHSGKKLEGGRLEDFHVVTLDAKNSDQISRKTHWDGWNILIISMVFYTHFRHNIDRSLERKKFFETLSSRSLWSPQWFLWRLGAWETTVRFTPFLFAVFLPRRWVEQKRVQHLCVFCNLWGFFGVSLLYTVVKVNG